jgi:uncharacterized membrane protein
MTATAKARRQNSAILTSHRFWEIDALRGVAIVMMVIFHLMWDLWYYRVLPDLVLYAGFWKYFQRTTAILFIFLVGVSLTVSYNRWRAKHPGEPAFSWRGWRKYLLRGLGIFGWGMLISLIVYISGVGYLHFGVLHLIGFGVAFAYPFLTLRWTNLFLWMVFFVAGGIVQDMRVESVYWVWLGLVPTVYVPVDYFRLLFEGVSYSEALLPPRIYAPVDFFPILPWFGVILLGIFAGNSFYTSRGRLWPLPDLSGWLPVRWLQFLGRHSLIIYLLHQVALFMILAALGLIPFF